MMPPVFKNIEPYFLSVKSSSDAGCYWVVYAPVEMDTGPGVLKMSNYGFNTEEEARRDAMAALDGKR